MNRAAKLLCLVPEDDDQRLSWRKTASMAMRMHIREQESAWRVYCINLPPRVVSHRACSVPNGVSSGDWSDFANFEFSSLRVSYIRRKVSLVGARLKASESGLVT